MRKKEEERYELQMHKNQHYQTSINAPATSHHFRRQGNYTGELSIEPDQRSEDSEEIEIFEDKQGGSSDDEGGHDQFAKIVFDGEDEIEEPKMNDSGHSSHKHQTRRNSQDALRVLEDSIINETFNQRRQDAT